MFKKILAKMGKLLKRKLLKKQSAPRIRYLDRADHEGWKEFRL